MKLLILSNGHGEDEIAARVIARLQGSPSCPHLAALPLVGEGRAYAPTGVPLLEPVRSLPSGGFINQDLRQFGRDIRAGLLGLTTRQFRRLREWGRQGGKILAVGDIVPLALAWSSGAEHAFVGTAKSEYYLRDERGWLESATPLDRWFGSYYYPWERWLMGRSRCRAIFPRDGLTAEVLKRWSLPVIDAGNPMMDDLVFAVEREIPTGPVPILLLPGSRHPECLENWQKILAALTAIRRAFTERELEFLVAIAPTLSLEMFIPSLPSGGWQPLTTNKFICQGASLTLSRSSYKDFLHRGRVAIAMAGTATEQFVGLGKPAITIEGSGPQFTPRFARLQGRLLGPSVRVVSRPGEVVAELKDLLQDPERWRAIAENGHRRMGGPGASERIARWILSELVG